MVFAVFLFLAGTGGLFFRMARDNDDLVRMALVLISGAAVTYVYVRERIKIPAALLVPSLAFAGAMLFSSFYTVNPVESLREFSKIGIYLLVFLALASTASRRVLARLSSRQIIAAGTLAILGIMLGYIHAHSPAGRETFRLWSSAQVVASIVTSCLFCASACILLSTGTLRRGILAALILQAVIACAIGILQFYGFDPLRPWDPRQPYSSYLRGNPQFLEILAGLTGGVLKMEGDNMVLELNRILGIYGNPDFFAPFLLQFIPLGVAIYILDPSRRIFSGILTASLVLTLILTNVRGGTIGLIFLGPFFGMIMGYVAPSMKWSQAASILARPALVFGATVFAFAMVGVMLVNPKTRLYLGGVQILVAVLHGMVFYTLIRVYRDKSGRLLLSAFALIGLYIGTFALARHIMHIRVGAIEERLVKYRMAAEMWRMHPLTGVGLNAYKTWYPQLQQQVRLRYGWTFEELGSSGTQENRTHNDIAQMLAETGVIGTGAFLWLMTSLIAGALRYLKGWEALTRERLANVCGLLGGALAILLYMLPNFPLHIVSSAATFWVILGLLASYRVPDSPDEGPADLPRGSFWALSAASAGTLILVSIFSIQLLAGTILYKRGDYLSRQAQPPMPLAAIKFYERALALDPSNGQYHYDFGAMCFNTSSQNPGAHDDLVGRARELLLQAKAKGFISEDLAYGLGHLAENEGDFDEALRWYALALQLKERHPHARQGRIRILRRGLEEAEQANGRGQFDKSRALFRAAFEKDPKNWLAALYVGSLSATPFGDLNESIRYLSAAAKLAPNEPSIYLALAKVFAMADRLPDTRRALALAATLDPENAEVKNTLAQLASIGRNIRGAGTQSADPGKR